MTRPPPPCRYCLQYFSFKFGAQDVMRRRLGALVATIDALRGSDPLAALIARFAGVGDAPPLPTEALTPLLQCLDAALEGSPPALNMAAKEVSVRVSVANACIAVRAAGALVPYMDVTAAEAALRALAPGTKRRSAVEGSSGSAPGASPAPAARNMRAMIDVVILMEHFVAAWEPAHERSTDSIARTLGGCDRAGGGYPSSHAHARAGATAG